MVSEQRRKRTKVVHIIGVVCSWGENVTTVGVCVNIPPTVIFGGINIVKIHKQILPAGSSVKITESDHINETVLLELLQYFQKLLANASLYYMSLTFHCSLQLLN
jgi:hypothetical protein